MEFNSDGICILESITHPDECDAYTIFLLSERRRHSAALDTAEDQCDRASVGDCLFTNAYGAFFRSATTRHQQDIDGIDRLIPKIQAHQETLCK